MIEEILRRNPMETKIFWPWELPQHLEGPAVMIDVNSASAHIANLVDRAKELYLATKDNVRLVLKDFPDAYLIGQSDDPILRAELEKRFSSPHEFSSAHSHVVKAPVDGVEVILITNNGTHTVEDIMRTGADPIIVVSYLNLHTVVEWLLSHKSWKSVTIVPSGGREKAFQPNPKLLEDLLCARAMEDLLKERPHNFSKDIAESGEFLRNSPGYKDERWPTRDEDLALILQTEDTYRVVPICTRLSSGFIQVTNALSP